MITIPVDPANPTNAEIFAAISETFDATTGIKSICDDLKTESIGSWVWDKGTGILTMFDTTGVSKFKFAVADSASEAKRERRQDLE